MQRTVNRRHALTLIRHKSVEKSCEKRSDIVKHWRRWPVDGDLRRVSGKIAITVGNFVAPRRIIARNAADFLQVYLRDSDLPVRRTNEKRLFQ